MGPMENLQHEQFLGFAAEYTVEIGDRRWRFTVSGDGVGVVRIAGILGDYLCSVFY